MANLFRCSDRDSGTFILLSVRRIKSVQLHIDSPYFACYYVSNRELQL